MNNLRRALQEVVPAPASSPDRVAAAYRSAARRAKRRAAAVGLTVLAAIGTGLVWAHMGGNEPDSLVRPGKTLNCSGIRAATDVVDDPQLYTQTLVAPGVRSARLCLHTGYGHTQVPADVLAYGVEALARQIDSLRVVTKHLGCIGTGQTTFDIVFGYEGGRTKVVWLDTQVCGAVEVNHQRLGGVGDAIKIRNEYLRLVEEQRAHLGAPERPAKVALACDVQPNWLTIMSTFPPSAMTRALVCRYGADGIELSAVQLGVINADLEARARARAQDYGPGCRQKYAQEWIVAQSIWGDRFRIDKRCDTFEVGGNSGQWIPGPKAKAIINQLVEDQQLPRGHCCPPLNGRHE